MAGPLPFDPIAEARRHWAERGWAGTADAMAAVTSVMRVQQIYLQRVDSVLKGFGLSFARFELLTLLSFSRSGALPLGKIGVRLQVHAASVTNAVDRLEAEGLVVRVAHPDDGRITLARITPKGRRVQTKAAEALNEQVFSDIALVDGEVERLTGLLTAVRTRSGDFASD